MLNIYSKIDKIFENSEEDLITRIAWLYYQEKLTQQEIADHLSLSRQKVQRLLERARDMEIIHFHIKHPYYNLLKIEGDLVKKFGLKDAVVVPAAKPEGDFLRKAFAKACSSYLERLLNRVVERAVIGFGWGNTTAYLADFFDPPVVEERKIEVVSLIGNLMVNVAMNPYITGEKIARKLNAPFYNIWAPAIAQSKERADIFKSELWIKEVLGIAERSDVIVISIGEASESASLFKMGYLSNEDLDRLIQKGAVGDILCRFIDKEGKVIQDEIHHRVIGIPLDVLEDDKKLVIAVAGGASKFEAIFAAIRGGYIDVLVTDEEIARRLIDVSTL
ncbi:MAG: hypothetical protein DRP87_16160 [Spirochaetes bacterium]|nr:MAG: hypothetical protein DRP87_16160 [Spirochaetota bacterium]